MSHETRDFPGFNTRLQENAAKVSEVRPAFDNISAKSFSDKNVTENLVKTGRILFGIAMVGLGLQSIYFADFPYMLLPPHHFPTVVLAYFFGVGLALAGGSIVFEKRAGRISLMLGVVLLLIFLFYHIPYELMVSVNYLHFGDWENAAKELALSSGALVIAGCFSNDNEARFTRLIPLGSVLFSMTICSFGVDHFIYAVEATGYMPSWVPAPLFFIYFTGTALFCSGIAIAFKIIPSLAATLLGAMIFTWFIILHIPKVIASPVTEIGDELASAFLALAYSGIAFVIAGATRKTASQQ